MHFLNFSYGSNMLSRRLRERTPSAQALGSGVLHGFELRWHKLGQDGSGKCDVQRSSRPGAQVHGVLYRIDLQHKPLLDAAEGLGRGYDELQLEVLGPKGLCQAWLYVATDIDAASVPYTWYKALVLAGAHEHGLPPSYIAALQAVAARDDEDVQRAARHFALTQGR